MIVLTSTEEMIAGVLVNGAKAGKKNKKAQRFFRRLSSLC